MREVTYIDLKGTKTNHIKRQKEIYFIFIFIKRSKVNKWISM